MQEEVTQKTVTFCIRTTKVTADLLKKVLAAYLRHQKQKSVEKKAKKNQPKQGKVTVKELAKQNAGMVNIEITNKNIKSFERYARKYGINYALKKDKSKDPPMYLVFFKGRDQDALNAAFREFSQKQIQKANKPSIHKRDSDTWVAARTLPRECSSSRSPGGQIQGSIGVFISHRRRATSFFCMARRAASFTAVVVLPDPGLPQTASI